MNEKTTINPVLPPRDQILPEMVANLMHNLPGMAYRCLYDENWTMIYLSESCNKVIGYTSSEILNNASFSYEEIIHKDDRAYVRNSVDEAVKNRTQFQMEYRIIDKNGAVRWVWEQGNAIYDAQNKPQWLDGYISGIDKRKKVEDELKQVARNMVELNATKDKFLTLIAHDLQNPVFALVSLSEFLLDNHKAFNDKELEEFVLQVNNSARGLYSLLENLLDWARTQTGRIPIFREHVSISKVLNIQMHSLSSACQSKKIQIAITGESDAVLETDSKLLSSILRNLLSNAIKYSHPESRIRLHIDTEPEAVVVYVKDKGIGIPRRYLERIFRIDNDYKMLGTNNEDGSGLGLILVKSHVDKLGGEISVTSKLNHGSTFVLRLPLVLKTGSE